MSLSDYAKLPMPDDLYLIDKFLPCPGRVLLVGPPKQGKSYLAMQIALAVAQGTPFLGRPSVSGGCRTLYLQFDTPHSLWLQRIQDLEEEHIHLPDNFFQLHPSDQRPFLDIANNESDVKYLEDAMDTVTPKFVVVDTLAKLHTGDENDAGAMKKVFHKLNRIFAHCCILYVHHTKKLSPPPGQKAVHRPSPSDAARGSSFVAGEVDSVMLLFNHRLTTEPRFDEHGDYQCQQDPHTKLWEFAEVIRLAGLESDMRKRFAMKPWSSWNEFRKDAEGQFKHIPDHLLQRLKRDLGRNFAPSSAEPETPPVTSPDPVETSPLPEDTSKLHSADVSRAVESSHTTGQEVVNDLPEPR